jgi:5-methylcytosine-specific restriction enzyme A
VGNATGGVHRPLVVLRRERRDHLPVDRAHIPRSDLRMADSGGMEGVKRGAAQYRWPSLGSEEWQHEGPPSARCPDAPRLRPCPEHPARQGSTRAWRRVRLQALQRDRFRCVRCGREASEVDHVVAREVGGTDALANLRSLCAACHAARHGRVSAPPSLRPGLR